MPGDLGPATSDSVDTPVGGALQHHVDVCLAAATGLRRRLSGPALLDQIRQTDIAQKAVDLIAQFGPQFVRQATPAVMAVAKAVATASVNSILSIIEIPFPDQSDGDKTKPEFSPISV